MGDVIGMGRLAHQCPVHRRLTHQGVVFERDIHMGEWGPLTVLNAPITIAFWSLPISLLFSPELCDQAPQVVVELENTEAYVGTVGRLKCRFLGQPEPRIHW